MLRYGGLVGVAHEVFVSHLDRPAILGILGLMMGLGEIAEAIKRGDIKRVKEGDGE